MICWGAIIFLVYCAPAFAATSVDLDRDWFFRTDPGQIGSAAGWQRKLPAETESVNLPHTWNIGRHDSYLGKAWYFRAFEMPARTANLHVKLHFGATFYSARIWLNGAEVGGHEGGYTAYSLDITPFLRDTNYLAVEIDNRISEATIPGFAMRGSGTTKMWYDWWDYGGIVRDVWLTLTGNGSGARSTRNPRCYPQPSRTAFSSRADLGRTSTCWRGQRRSDPTISLPPL